MTSSSPALRAAARSGAVTWWISGYASGAVAVRSAWRRLTIPRARRPEKARVRPVGRADGERGAVRRGRPRLGAEHERGADLGGRGARREHGRDAAAGGDAAGRDEGDVDVRADELEQREQPVVDAVLAVDERAAVPARLRALDDERAGAGGDRLRAPRRGR